MLTSGNPKKRDILSSDAAKLLGTSDLVEQWTDCCEGDKFFDTDGAGGGVAVFNASTLEVDTTTSADASIYRYTTDNKAGPIKYGPSSKWMIACTLRLTYSNFVSGCRASVEQAQGTPNWRLSAWYNISSNFFVFTTDGGNLVTTKAVDQLAHEWKIVRDGTTTTVYCDGVAVGSADIYPTAAGAVKGLALCCFKPGAERLRAIIDWVYIAAPRDAL